jgi:hypothetical protein
MMPKSLLHQTLAKLFSENGPLTSVFCHSVLKEHSLNKQHSTEIPKLCQAFFLCCFFTTRYYFDNWSEWRESNSRPPAPKAGVLPG